MAALDRELAAFVSAHPGIFEARLLEGVPELAEAVGPFELGQPTLLAVWFDLRPPSASIGSLPATFPKLDPASMLAVHGRARRDHLEALGPTAVHNAVGTAVYQAVRAGRAALARAPLAPEFRDLVAAIAFHEPLPDVLPPRVHELSADAIEHSIAVYLDLTPDRVTRRLRRGGGTGGEFLGPADRLGETILDDARALHALGVSHRTVAARLDELVTIGGPDAYRRGAFDVHLTSYLGHQDDPFHTADAYGVERRGATDFQILNHTLPEPNAITGGDRAARANRRGYDVLRDARRAEASSRAVQLAWMAAQARARGEDTDWILRAVALGVRRGTVPEVLLLRRIHRGNLSHGQAPWGREVFGHLRAAIRRGRGPTDEEDRS